jgi:hypothetical protein
MTTLGKSPLLLIYILPGGRIIQHGDHDPVRAFDFHRGNEPYVGDPTFRNKDRIKILAIADMERHEFLPDVPTFKELGIDVDRFKHIKRTFFSLMQSKI